MADQMLKDLEMAKVLENLTLTMRKQQEEIARLSKHVATTCKGQSVLQLAKMMEPFVPDRVKGFYYSTWYERNELIFQEYAAHLGDQDKVQLLLMKLAPAQLIVFYDTIYPKKKSELTFEEVKKVLNSLYSVKLSLLRRRLQVFQMQMRPDEDIDAIGARVNRAAEEFYEEPLTEDQFKCLIFLHGLRDPKLSELQEQLIEFAETRPELTLGELTKEAIRLESNQRDWEFIQEQNEAGQRHRSKNAHKKKSRK